MRGFVQQVRSTLSTHDRRLTSRELRLGLKAAITEEQAAEIALAVKNVGQQLSSESTQSSRNGYAMVYSELYRRYGVSPYVPSGL